MKTKNKLNEIETQAASSGETSAKWLLVMYRLRKEMRLNQTKFAEVIGMSKDAVVSWECGRNKISSTSALRMSARLGRNLFDGTLAPGRWRSWLNPGSGNMNAVCGAVWASDLYEFYPCIKIESLSHLQKAGLVPCVRRWLGGMHAGAIRQTGEIRRLDVGTEPVHPTIGHLPETNSGYSTADDQCDEADR